MTSLAHFVLDIVDQLRTITGGDAVDPILSCLSVREVTFSVPYDPGAHMPPLPLPSDGDGILAMSLQEARSHLLARDRRVALERMRLLRAPAQRIARLELKIRLLE
jgi:hypothetical protein